MLPKYEVSDFVLPPFHWKLPLIHIRLESKVLFARSRINHYFHNRSIIIRDAKIWNFGFCAPVAFLWKLMVKGTLLQTSRKLSTKIAEHCNHINWNTTNRSVTDHRIEFNHDFDWENVQILDHEKFLNKRLISEKTHILMQKNDLNLFRHWWTSSCLYDVNEIDQLTHFIFILYLSYILYVPLLRILFYDSS